LFFLFLLLLSLLFTSAPLSSICFTPSFHSISLYNYVSFLFLLQKVQDQFNINNINNKINNSEFNTQLTLENVTFAILFTPSSFTKQPFIPCR
jgi:hypothetical protein